MINKTLSNMKDCTGCHACTNICPKKCIFMKDDNEGFLYPIVDYNICIKCKRCVNVCPINNNIKSYNTPIAYACYNKDENIRLNSSSGGIFSLLAEKMIDRGGVVFGAVFNDNFEVEHKYIETKENIELLRGSKYVQSKIGTSYRQVKDFLESGREVLFSGTPCQIAGLKNYLVKAYSNLLTVDLICHGVPSPYVWQKYIKFRENKAGSEISKITFRNKKMGWKQFSVSFLFKNNTEYNKIYSNDLYMTAFLKNISLRPSCYNCRFKTLNRPSDITLADFWGVQNIFPEIDDDKGASLIFINSQLGEKIYSEILDNIVYKEVDILDAVKYNSAAIKSPLPHINREKFINDINIYTFDKLVNKYCKDRISIKLILEKIMQVTKKD